MANPNLPRDYNFGDPLVPTPVPDRIEGPAYFADKPPADYGPRDKRVWLRQCLHVGCPVERCLDMPEQDYSFGFLREPG